MTAPQPHVTKGIALQAAREVLQQRPLSESALRAALKAKRLPLTLAQLADLLRDDGFVLRRDGRWQVAEASQAATKPIEWQPTLPVTHLTYPQFAARLQVAEAQLRQSIPVLARLHPDVDWLALDRRLRSGDAVAIRESTVDSARTALVALEAARELQAPEHQPDDSPTSAQSTASGSAMADRHGPHRDDPDGVSLPVIRERLEAELRAAQSEREAAAAARREAEDAKQNLIREMQDEIVHKAQQVRAADDARRKAVQEERKARAGKVNVARALPLKKTLLGWQETNAGWMYAAAPAATEGEKELRRQLREVSGVALLNCHIWDGAKEREVDAIVIHPRGVVSIEQKDIGRGTAGRLEVPLNGPVTVDGHEVGHDQARHQARMGAQMLASIAKREPLLDAGFITAFLAFHGDLDREQELQRGNVRVVLTETVAPSLTEYFEAREKSLTKSVARDLLRRLEVPALDESRISKLGFLNR